MGGFIRVKPTDFTFASTARNVIVAQAVGWNLDTLVKQFEIPDLKLQGKGAATSPWCSAPVQPRSTMLSLHPPDLAYPVWRCGN